MIKVKIAIAAFFLGSVLFAVTNSAGAYPPFVGKAKKFGAKDCTFCHVDPLGGPPWNDRGKWLVQEKARRKADVVNVEWLAEYPADAKKQEGKPAEAAAGQAKKIDTKILDSYVGDYEAEIGVLRISRDGDRLFGEPDGGEKKELIPESETKFKVMDVNATVVFVKDDAGKVTGMELDLNGQQIKAKKIK